MSKSNFQVPWERPVREVSLAAQVGAVDQMSHNWYLMIKAVRAHASAFNEIYQNRLREWAGEAADAAHQKWREVFHKIESVADNYGAGGSTRAGVPGSLSACAHAIHSTIDVIPIPLFAGFTANSDGVGHYGAGRTSVLPGGTADTGSGAGLYQDYRGDRGSYADYAFKERALKEHDVEGTRTRSNSSHGGDYDSNPAVERWYNTNSQTANKAHSSLRAIYNDHMAVLPRPVLYSIPQDSHQPPKGPGGCRPWFGCRRQWSGVAAIGREVGTLLNTGRWFEPNRN